MDSEQMILTANEAAKINGFEFMKKDNHTGEISYVKKTNELHGEVKYRINLFSTTGTICVHIRGKGGVYANIYRRRASIQDITKTFANPHLQDENTYTSNKERKRKNIEKHL